jgi:inhibitor of KinA
MKPDPSLRRVAPFTYEIAFEAIIAPEIHDHAIRCRMDLLDASLPGIDDVFITYHSVGIRISPFINKDIEHLLRDWLSTWLQKRPTTSDSHRSFATHVIPVTFGGDYGIDLQDVAAFAQISEQEVIRMFCENEYRVYMTGFIGGFPYLGTVPEALRKPRLAKPRKKVIAGSVGIASFQAGIYPVETPGGWNLIGRTEVDISSLSLQPGDRVRFTEARHD